jgi:hypothetical protein
MKKLELRKVLCGMLFVVISMSASLAVAAADSTPPPPVATKAIVGTLVAKPNSWAKIEFADVKKFPWDGSPESVNKDERFSNPSKTFFNGPDREGAFVYSEFAPSFSSKKRDGPPGAPHYHTFWEMGYTLRGDSAMKEPVSPDYLNPMHYHKKEGGWLTRPPGGLHGGGLPGGRERQMPYYLLLFEEGDGSVITLGPSMFGPKADHYQPDFPTEPDPYMPDWKAVKDYAKPWFVDSIGDVEWEDDPNVPGRFVKWLDESKAEGFRALLVKIAPGWTPPTAGHKEYFEHANRMRYMLWGDMKVWSFDGPADEGKAVRVEENGFIYQPPRSIWGYGPGSVSEKGAIWLEMTWAKGLTHGGGPIEEPKTPH